MIKIPFLLGELALAVVWLLARVCVWIKRRKIDKKQEAKLLLMFINLAILVRIAFFPFFRQDGEVQPLIFDAQRLFPLNVNLIPFANFFQYDTPGDMWLNILGNILLFVPTGAILPFVYKRLNTFGKVLLTGVCMSVCIELLQLPFFERTTDINDVIFNTLGCALGYGIYIFCKLMRARWTQKKETKRRG
jgi:glycopeptide antibiotics resistance protein